MNELITINIDETKKFACSLGKNLKKGDFLALVGDLGSGKTVFVKGLAKGLGIDHRYVNSPTFVIVKEYKGRLNLYHFDIYRLNDEKSLEDIGASEYFFGNGVTAMEWADKAPDLIPEEHLRIEFKVAGDNKRRIKFIPFGDRYKRIVKKLF